MSGFDPKAYLAKKKASSSGGFDPQAYLAKKSQGDVGMGEAFLRGGQQGSTLGFGDELSGLVAQGVDWAQGLFGESPIEMAERMKAEGVRIPKGVPSSRDELYAQVRDEERAANRGAQEQNPWTYGGGGLVGGGALNAIPGVGLAGGAGYGATALNAGLQGVVGGAGLSEAEDASGIALDSLAGGATGAAIGPLAKYGFSKAAPIASKAAGYVGDKLRGAAERFAVKATGATGKQAGEFADDAGRELLDRKYVRFGDAPDDIANRLGDAVDAAGEEIGKILEELDAKGIKSTLQNVKSALQEKVAKLSGIPGNERVVRQIEGELQNLAAYGDEIAVSTGEKAKRAYQAQTNYASDEAHKTASGTVARALREETERAATEAEPAVAQLFKDEKRTIGLFDPIREAAEARARTLNQSPAGGLGDIASEAVANGKTFGGAAIGRRLLAPRLSSSLAISTDALSRMATQAPQALGKFAGVLQKAGLRGPQAVSATHFVLQQSNPEYREMLRKMQEEEDAQ